MSQIYTIDEILLAVDEIQNKKIKTPISSKKIDLKKEDYLKYQKIFEINRGS